MSNFIIILLQASINSANGIFCLWLWDGKGAIYFAKREKPLKGWPKGNILMVILAEAERSIRSKSREMCIRDRSATSLILASSPTRMASAMFFSFASFTASSTAES